MNLFLIYSFNFFFVKINGLSFFDFEYYFNYFPYFLIFPVLIWNWKKFFFLSFCILFTLLHSNVLWIIQNDNKLVYCLFWIIIIVLVFEIDKIIFNNFVDIKSSKNIEFCEHLENYIEKLWILMLFKSYKIK